MQHYLVTYLIQYSCCRSTVTIQPKIQPQVQRTKGQTFDVTCTGDFTKRLDSFRTFDQRPDAFATGSHAFNLLAALGFG
ncbi:hypothetical protein D3C80_1029530 [compost metagenome]